MDLTLPVDDFLNSEFGSDASLNSGATIRAIFYEPYATNRISEIEIEGSRPYADCKTTDVSSAAQDQSFVHNSVTYKVEEIQSGDDGWTRLILYKANT